MATPILRSQSPDGPSIGWGGRSPLSREKLLRAKYAVGMNTEGSVNGYWSDGCAALVIHSVVEIPGKARPRKIQAYRPSLPIGNRV